MDDIDVIRVSATAQQHVAAYLEYNAIVGNADDGVMMSEEEVHSQIPGFFFSFNVFFLRNVVQKWNPELKFQRPMLTTHRQFTGIYHTHKKKFDE